jgi:Flp pilus assembly protein TadB
MYLLSGMLAAAAVVALGMATLPQPATGPRASWFERLVERSAGQLRAARLHVDPRSYTIACLVSPPALLSTGLVLGSPVVAVLAGIGGLAVPRLYLNALVRAQRRRSEAQAPRLLETVLASLTAGRTYLEALQEARNRATDRWLREDLDHIISQFHLDVPLEQSIAEVRALTSSRNLALIWDNLSICVANHIPASRARGLLAELSSTIQYNVQLQSEVRARTSGQRAQIWLLAAIVPGLFLYLRTVNSDFFSVLNDTATGRFLLFPLAVFLEVFGIVLSFRVSRVEV